jgi:hypothetical protein
MSIGPITSSVGQERASPLIRNRAQKKLQLAKIEQRLRESKPRLSDGTRLTMERTASRLRAEIAE